MCLRILLLGICLLVASAQGLAQTRFPSNAFLEKKTKFWEAIFSRYHSDQLVIHDTEDLGIILAVVKDTEDHAREVLEPYEMALASFVSDGPKAQHQSKLKKKIWQLYSQNPKAKRRLLTGQVAIRAQGGLKDTFQTAFQTSKLYLPQMERIFRDYGLPPELTRIAFVESMFNIKARSKVGASGVWQLMPKTAAQYLQVNRRVDERNSPLKATHAAAKILRMNYRELGHWPLAITAYNHGLGGMQRAVARAQSRELSQIIQNYESPSFGFASRNFYAEFLAAKRVYQTMAKASAKSPRSLAQAK